MRSLTSLVLAALLAAIASTACAAGPKALAAKKATIALTQYSGSASIYVAREKGFFRDAGIEPAFKNYPSGGLALAAVLDGSGDFGTCAETPLARAALNGKPLAVVATLAEVEHSNVVVARKDRGITSASDLKGKRVGVAKGTAADFFLHIFLTAAGIDTMSVNVVYVKPDEVVDALTSGTFDAVCTWPPYSTKLVSVLGKNGIVLDEPGLYTLAWNVAVRQELVKKDPDLIVRFLRAITKADDYIAQHPEEAQAITAKAVGVDAATVKARWGDLRIAATLDQSLLLSLEDQSRWMRASEPTGQPGLPNFLDFIYTGGLKAVRPADVRIIE